MGQTNLLETDLCITQRKIFLNVNQDVFISFKILQRIKDNSSFAKSQSCLAKTRRGKEKREEERGA